MCMHRSADRWRDASVAVVAVVAVTVLVLVILAFGGARAEAATWSTVTTPNGSGAEDSALYDMACEPGSTNACTAVGKQTAAGVSTPYAQYWNGSSWANQTTAAPVGATASELQADTCLSTTSCVAVGHYTTGLGTFSLAEAWNGTSWSIQSTPNPAGATDSRLRGVSCAVITACIAVGYSIDSRGVKSAMAQRGNSGSWSLQTLPAAPVGAIGSELQGVDCTSATSCVAVGRYDLSATTYWAWSATWNGTSWTQQTVPRPTGAQRSTLLDVSCSDASDCTGVGGYMNSSGVQVSFAVRWNGTTWTQQTTPNPAGSSNTVLQNVSCADRGWCVGVGDWLNAGTWQPMAQSWNGSSWSLDTTVNPTGSTFGLLEGVACRITCLAIGWYTSSGGADTTLGESRPAPSWVQKTLPTPVAEESLSDITCTSANACFAVGLGAERARMFTGGSGTWIFYGELKPAGAVFSQLRGVHCVSSPYFCATVGVYNVEGGLEMPYAFTDIDSGEWDVRTVPTPGGASAALNEVHCSSSTACMAVGDYKVEGVAKAFASFWNGSAFSTKTPLNAASSTTNVLTSVACVSASDCIAVGYASVNGTTVPLVERWNGTSWTLHTSPLPSGTSTGRLIGVSCTSSGPTCMAVGSAGEQAYVLRWAGSGTTWTVEAAPRPVFAQSAQFEDVSCTSSTACVAAGSYVLSSGVRKTLAAEWDGTSWTLHSTTSPGTSGNGLLGVSCVTATVCRASGYGNSGSGSFNLVETLN